MPTASADSTILALHYFPLYLYSYSPTIRNFMGLGARRGDTSLTRCLGSATCEGYIYIISLRGRVSQRKVELCWMQDLLSSLRS